MFIEPSILKIVIFILITEGAVRPSVGTVFISCDLWGGVSLDGPPGVTQNPDAH